MKSELLSALRGSVPMTLGRDGVVPYQLPLWPLHGTYDRLLQKSFSFLPEMPFRAQGEVRGVRGSRSYVRRHPSS